MVKKLNAKIAKMSAIDFNVKYNFDDLMHDCDTSFDSALQKGLETLLIKMENNFRAKDSEKLIPDIDLIESLSVIKLLQVPPDVNISFLHQKYFHIPNADTFYKDQQKYIDSEIKRIQYEQQSGNNSKNSYHREL